MNIKMVKYILSMILCAECVFMLFPILVAVSYGEFTVIPSFAVAMALAAATALVLGIKKPENDKIFSKESFVAVAVGWVLLSIFGAVPYYASGSITNVADAIFESVSGFTTTGASVLRSPENVFRSILFWRSFTHWIGGMGIIVFLLMITQISEGHSMYIMRAEVPGPSVGKVAPKAKSNSLILYGIYTGLTILEIIALLLGGLGWFDAVTTSMSTAGTGGFAANASSIAAYGSNSIEWIVSVFMFLFGVNFNIYVLALAGNVLSVFKSEELKTYLAIVLISTAVIAVDLTGGLTSFADALRKAFFQVNTVITTTGFYCEPYMEWSNASKGVILLLMFTGACAGSTAGGLKLSRIIIGAKAIRNSARQLIHPHDVTSIKFEDKSVDKETKNFIMIYFGIFFLILFGSTFVLMESGWDYETSFGTALTCFNNVGVSFGRVAEEGCFDIFSAPVKLFLSLLMLTGRLEIFPMILLFAPSTWKRQ